MVRKEAGWEVEIEVVRQSNLIVRAPVAAPFPFPARDPAPVLCVGRGAVANESTCSQRVAVLEPEPSDRLDNTCR